MNPHQVDVTTTAPKTKRGQVRIAKPADPTLAEPDPVEPATPDDNED